MIVIWDVPVPDTRSVSVTSIVSITALPFLMVMFPLSVSTFSLKLRTIVASTATPVALSAGTDEVNVGSVKPKSNALPSESTSYSYTLSVW